MLVCYMIFYHHELVDISVNHLGIIRTYAQFQLKGALTHFNDKYTYLNMFFDMKEYLNNPIDYRKQIYVNIRNEVTSIVKERVLL